MRKRRAARIKKRGFHEELRRCQRFDELRNKVGKTKCCEKEHNEGFSRWSWWG